MSTVSALLATLHRQEQFGPACFDILSQFYNDPVTLFREFTKFVSQILLASNLERVNALCTVQSAIYLSPLLLAAFITALDGFNGSDGQSVTLLHTLLNQELPKMDWSRLTSARVLTEVPTVRFPKGPLDSCICEILFSNIKLTELAASAYCEIEAGDLYSVLSARARDRFADANIRRSRGNPIQLLDRIRVSHRSFLVSIFRRRDDLGSLLATFAPPNGFLSAYVQSVVALEPLVPPACLLAFFLGAIFPAVDSFPPEFLTAIFERPGFPSDDLVFPAQDFLASTICLDCMSFKMFFDLFARAPDEALMGRVFDRLIETNDDPMVVLTAFFHAPKQSVDHFRSLFLRFIDSSHEVSSDLLDHAASRHLLSRPETVSGFYSALVSEAVQPELFLAPLILGAFWDYAFISPAPTLRFLSAVTVNYGDSDIVREFWESPTTIPCIVDAIVAFDDSSSAFISFLLEMAKVAPEWLVEKLGASVHGLSCAQLFLQNCYERFKPGSFILLALESQTGNFV
jgi:hypothetical protein